MLTPATVRGILVLREDFSARLMRPTRWPAQAQLLANATDPNTARILEGYVQGALLTWAAGRADGEAPAAAGRHHAANTATGSTRNCARPTSSCRAWWRS